MGPAKPTLAGQIVLVSNKKRANVRKIQRKPNEFEVKLSTLVGVTVK